MLTSFWRSELTIFDQNNQHTRVHRTNINKKKCDDKIFTCFGGLDPSNKVEEIEIYFIKKVTNKTL